MKMIIVKFPLLFFSFFFTFSMAAYILGSQNQFNTITVQSNGKIIAAGFTIIDNKQKLLIARYASDGSLDATFGSSGVQTTAVGDLPVVYAIAIDSSNNIIIAGSTLINKVGFIVLAKYLSNGSLDTSFGNNGIVLSSFESGCSCYAMNLEEDNKITLTGSILKNDDVWIPLIRYNSDGTLDASFGINGLAVIELEDCAVGCSIIKQPDNKYVVAGSAEGQSFVARVDSNGMIDGTFGTNGATVIEVGNSSFLKGCDFQSTGKIVVAGYSEGQCLLARLNVDGKLDTSFGTSGITLNSFGAYNVLLDMAVDSSDRIMVVGLSDDTAILSCYTAIGILDASFGNSGLASIICGYIGNANAIKIQTDDKVLCAGFSDNNALIARVNNNGIFDVGFGANGLALDPTDYFPTCVADSSGSSEAYLFAYDTTNQTISVANSFQDIIFNTNAQLLNWAHSSKTATFTCNKTGVYQITYTAASEKTSGSGLISGTFRLINNGVEIPGSQQVFEYSTNNQTTIQAKTLIATFTQGDVLKLQYAGSNTFCRLIAGDGVGAVRPSASLVIVQLS
ncbi:MAG: hypothetical protein AMXMBFR12_06880 [Candidatus Babeliales bacterium]